MNDKRFKFSVDDIVYSYNYIYEYNMLDPLIIEEIEHWENKERQRTNYICRRKNAPCSTFTERTRFFEKDICDKSEALICLQKCINFREDSLLKRKKYLERLKEEVQE